MNSTILKEIEKLLIQATGFGPTLLWNIIHSIVIIIAFWIIQYLLKLFLNKKINSAQSIYKWQKIISYTMFVLAAILVSRVWFAGIQDIATYLGIFSAGLAVAMKEPILNIAGWWFIMIKKWFVVGDRIQIGEHIGDVIDQQLSTFTLMEIGNWVQGDQSTGRIIHIPNSTVFTQVMANYTREFKYLWDELPIMITFESNWKKALELLTEIACKHSCNISKKAELEAKKTIQKMIIYYSSVKPKVFVSIEDSGILLSIRYVCEARNRRVLSEKIFIDILEEFSKHKDIDFAYPTQRLYYNPQEGKDKQNPSPQETFPKNNE